MAIKLFIFDVNGKNKLKIRSRMTKKQHFLTEIPECMITTET